MNYIFGVLIIISVICAFVTGNGQCLSDGIIKGTESSIELILTMAGMLMLWSGIMEIGARGGIIRTIGKLLAPPLRLLFKRLPKNSTALSYISMNVSANLLGLGNAATPPGLSAMEELHRLGGCSDTATDDMVIFVVMNTASIQLVPTMVGSLRQAYGSTTPFDILPCVWISSAVALLVGLTVAKLFMNGSDPK